MSLLLLLRAKIMPLAASGTIEVTGTAGAFRLDTVGTIEVTGTATLVQQHLLATAAAPQVQTIEVGPLVAGSAPDLIVASPTVLRAVGTIAITGTATADIYIDDAQEPAYFWRDPDGVEHPLDLSEGVLAEVGAGGLLAGQYDLRLQVTPFRDGARLRRVVTNARDVDLSIVLKADSLPAFERLSDAVFGTWFSPRRGGPGALLYRRTSGARRELVCWPEQIDAERDASNSGPAWQRAVVGLKALDGFWQDEADAVTRFVVTVGEPPRLLQPPLLPLKLAGGDPLLTGGFEVTGLPVWPVWTVEGPLERVVLRDETVDEEIDVAYPIAANQTIVIDTRPSERSIRLNGATRIRLEPGSTLWGFEALGQHTWTARFVGAVSGTTALTMAYRRRYSGE